MASKILNFSPDRLITGINIVDNMLFYTDGENEPKKINIEKFRGKATTGEFKDIPVDHSSGTTFIYDRAFEERDITVIKEHPSASRKKIETITLNESFGNGAGDITSGDVVNDSDFSITDVDEKEEEEPSLGVVTVYSEGGSLDGIELISETKYGKGIVEESGFIWSQTQESLNELISGAETGSAYQVSSENLEIEGNVANASYVMVKNDTTSPHYDVNLVAGDIYYVAFTKLKGQNSRIYSNVGKTTIIDNSVTTTVASDIVSTTPIKSPSGPTFEWKSKVGNTGGITPEEVGIYISDPKINTNEAPPTVQDLLDDGMRIPGSFSPDDEIIVFQEPLPNKYYYWFPYIKNKNGITYGNSLSTSDTVPNILKTNGFIKPIIKPLDVTKSDFDGNVFLRAFFEGNNSSAVNGTDPVTAVGFYFSKEETNSFDILNKTYNSAFPGSSTDGTSNKVQIPITVNPDSYSLEKGGGFTFNIANYIDVEPGEVVHYIPYAINASGETTGEIKKYELPKRPGKPNFNISNLDWRFKPNSENNNSGIRNTILLDYDLDVFDIDENLNIDDIGIIISKPSTVGEIINSTEGIWTEKDQIINSSNSISIKVPLKDLTFTGSGGNTKIGRYENTDPIEISNIDPKDYYNLKRIKKIKPDAENWSAIGYIIVDGVTYYTKPVNKLSDISNKNSTVKHNIIGAPRVYTKDTNTESFSNLDYQSATLKGKMSNYGKSLSEFGFYVSTTPPLSSSNFRVAAIDNDGRSSDLETWSATATKHISTNVSVASANSHLNQNTNNFLDFEADVTSLNPETTYYFVAFSNPVQTINSQNDFTFQGSETLNDIINDKKWGSIITLTTPKNENAITVATPPPLVEALGPEGGALYFTKIRAYLKGKLTIRSKDYSVTTKGYYLKAASEFPYPFSDQAGNAATMASATNRLTFIDDDTRIKRSIREKSFFFGNKIVPIDTIDYYYSFFVEVNETGERFISDYKLINNSINAVVPVPEIQSFQLSPPVISPGGLSNSANNYVSDTSKGISGTIVWQKEANTSGIPEIEKIGAYYINKTGASRPTNSSDFLNAYNNSGGQSGWNSSSKELEEKNINFSSDGKTATYTIPLPDNEFPSLNAGKTFYAIGFIEYTDGTFKYSDTVEEFFMPNPKFIASNIDEIYYKNTIMPTQREGGYGWVADVMNNGASILTPTQRELAYFGAYRPEKIEAKISFSGIESGWFFSVYTSDPRVTFVRNGKGDPGGYVGSPDSAMGRLLVSKSGNTLIFPHQFPIYASDDRTGFGTPNRTYYYYIIPAYKRNKFILDRKKLNWGTTIRSSLATSFYENYAEAVIKVIRTSNPPDNR